MKRTPAPVTLLSVNVSLPKEVVTSRGALRTGIFKEPVRGPVMARASNLDGDGQADRQSHGGTYKAIYAYPIEHYDYWKERLGRSDFVFGQFGENFTIEGVLEDAVQIGDVYRVGAALVQVTQPRAPCQKLALKMDRPAFPKEFLRSGRVGFYLRVLEEGAVRPGDSLELAARDPEVLTVREASRLRYLAPDDLEGTRRALRVEALPPHWRREFEDRLARAGNSGVG